MIFRLEYGNRSGDTARIDITTPGLPTVVEVEGTREPFILERTPDKPDKSFYFLTSSAEINIYETPEFNIDTLKTSSETDIKVDYYINGVKKWTGFVLPDFFNREIGGTPVVSMTASDRIGALKGVTLSDLPVKISLHELAILCLEKTGLDLPLKTMVDFSAIPSSGNDFFKSQIFSQRLIDNKGRSISCYDILRSILVTSNSKLIQRNAEWYIINKFQHELGIGELYSSVNSHTAYSEVTHDFSEITKGARMSIVPVAASVGVYHEFGGGQAHPDNYDFSKELNGWNPVGGFIASINNKEVTGYFQTYNPRYGDETEIKYLVNSNNYNRGRYIESEPITIPYSEGSVEIKVDINALGPQVQFGLGAAKIRFSIIADRDGAPTISMNSSGSFSTGDAHVFEYEFSEGSPLNLRAVTMNINEKGALMSPAGYSIKLRIYGSNVGVDGNVTRVTMINSATIEFSVGSNLPKGNIYKREQGSNFTKVHDIETTMFADYITKGLNGYFYNYRIDDTSSLYSPDGDLRSLWASIGYSEELPLLMHSVRQMARMFSVAHDKISGEIEMVNFDPLAVFVDCSGRRYVPISSREDFLNKRIEIELEEIAYQ